MMDDDVTFGEWLRRRRRVLDLTQRELAQRAGCGVTTIRKIEAGERRPSKELAAQLAACLGIPPEEHATFITFARAEVYPDRPPPPPPTTRPPGISSAQVAAVPLPPFLAQEKSPTAPPPVFVARERELEHLNLILEQTLAGRGQVAFVVGGAGRGKTALLTEFARRVHGMYPDLLVAIGNCSAHSGIGDPYLPFRDVMGMLTGDVQTKLAAGAISLEHARRLWLALSPTCQALLERGRNLIDVLVPGQELLARAKLALPHGDRTLEQLHRLAERPKMTKGDLAQAYLFQQMTNVLRAVAEQRPLLILLDDLQWADTTSLSLLFHLGRRLEASRILVVGAYRPEEVAIEREGERHPLEKLLAEFKRLFGDVWIDLAQTAEIEDRQFVEMILDTEPNYLEAAFRRVLYQHTGGHPLFTIELLRAMQERGDLVKDEWGQWIEGASLNWESLPVRVEAVIEDRISRLDEELRQILMVASVDGEVFTAQVVARVQAIGERKLLGQLSQALARKHRLVRERGDVQIGDQTLSCYQFSHILFQRYLYHRLGAGERRLLHGEIGAVLETLYGTQAEEIAVQLAHHFQEANLPGKARPYVRQSGEQAARQHANDEAIAYFNRALELTPADDLAERYDLLLASEKIHNLRGEREAQRQELAALQELAGALADDRRRVEVALRQAMYGEATGDYLAAIAAARAATELAQAALDVDGEAVGYQLWGRALLRQGDYQAAQFYLNRALALARTAHLPQVQADSLRSLGTVSSYLGNHAEGNTCFEEALLIYRELGNRQGESQSLNNLGVGYLRQAAYDESKAYYEQALHIQREIGDRQGEGNTLMNLGLASFQLGDYTRAHEYWKQALPILHEIGDRWGEAAATTNLALLLHQLGDDEAARDYSQQALLITRELSDRAGQGYALTNLGHALAGLGFLAEAIDSYQQALTLRRELGWPSLAMESLAGLARVSLAQGCLAQALFQVEEILSYLEHNSVADTEEPFRIYLTCYLVLQANQDARAQAILKTAHTLLQETAAKIGDEAMRRLFLENVAVHREIVTEFSKSQRNQLG